jgi:hypothetical protein
MKKLQYFISILFFVTLLISCKEEVNVYFDRNAPAPANVADIKVEATPGGAIITYKIPVDPNLSYIKAVYEIQPGIFREAKSSYYTDKVALVGFGDTLSHDVKLFSVGKNEKESEPLLVNFKPLIAPVQSAFKMLDVSPTFGGVNVSFKNSTQANLAIVLIEDTTGLGTWAPVTTFYTAALEGSFSARGYDAMERKFAIYLRDRWNNRSDTFVKVLTPLYEELIDKNTFKGIALPSDAALLDIGKKVDILFDGITNLQANLYATLSTNTIPQWFTFDMGKTVVISRFKAFHRKNYAYAANVPEIFELWGSNSPNINGSWDSSWQLLGKFNSFKPSGLPSGKLSTDDVDYAVVNGEDFEFKVIPPAVRYVRFKTLKTYGDIGQVVLSELTFWGEIKP